MSVLHNGGIGGIDGEVFFVIGGLLLLRNI